MRRIAKKREWNLKLNNNYMPSVTVIVATYNEVNVIINRLRNLEELDYPKDKLEVIIVDSASTDGTATIVKKYIRENKLPFKTLILEENERSGKAKALNQALQSASGNIIATSDADCLWPPDSLKNMVKYLSDPSVAAVCGQEVLINPNESSATRTESQYRGLFNYIRVGESKIHSTIAFEGALALFKRDLLQNFDESCDDSGSALNLVQDGYRTILVPDAFFLNPFPSVWAQKIAKKTRRAQHLIKIWQRCLKLDIRRELKLNPWISRSNVFLYVINPFLFVVFLFTLGLIAVNYPITLLAIPLILVVPKFRYAITLYLTNYLFLLYAILMQISGHEQIIWKK
jgi:cellulose synthase/poly-beta-1,6-N-acetylglucosamine synthase-like glycosyltransferase